MKGVMRGLVTRCDCMNLLDEIIIKGSVMLATINENTHPLDDILISNKLSSDSNLRGAAASFYRLMSVIGITGIALSITICGIALYRKDARKRQEAKSKLMIKCIIAIAIFGFAWLAGVILNITTSLV